MARVAAALLVLAGLPGAASAGPRVVNGLFTSQYPSSGALLIGSNPESAILTCSGTLIGCQTFLTAAHCVCDGTGGDCQPGGLLAPDPAAFHVFLQHAGIVAVSSIAVRSDFDFPVGDLAVVHLAAPVTGIAPAPANHTASPPAGMDGTIVGFGRSGGGNFDYGLKRVGHVTMAPCTDDVSNTTSTCWSFLDPLGAPGADANTCNGDSGGPLFVDFGCGGTVAGVTSGGSSDTCLPTDHSYDANVFTYGAWVATEGGADVTATTCGAMPQAGQVGAPIAAFVGVLDSFTTEGTHAVTVPAGTTSLRVAMNAIDDGGADFDLYVRFGAPPTTTTYDCRRNGSGQFAACEFASPAAGTWYVLVRRFAGTGPYQATATTFALGSPAPGTDGHACDDRNTCTGSDTCGGGNCTGVPLADGTPCDDGSACTHPDACAAGVCTGTAASLAGCHLPSVGGRASLLVRDDPTDARDQLVWKWAKGAATTAEFGDPVAATAYELCVYDAHADIPALVLDARIPAGASWSSFSRGFKYRDRTLASAGVGTVLLKDGAAASAAITLAAKGANLGAPALPFAQDSHVVVQLTNGTTCWEARYGTSRVNDAAQFKAKAD